MKGQTGGSFSMGNGSIYSTSTKQKLVSRSSTESELIGVHDVLPQLLWTRNFLKAQGCEVNDVQLYQDNTSAILLERNGRASSSKRTRHMDIRYFFITEQVNNKTISLVHCPTEEMVADFFTKPLQGSLFRRLRNRIMNLAPDSPYYSREQRSVLSGRLDSDTDKGTTKECSTSDTGNGRDALTDCDMSAEQAEHCHTFVADGHVHTQTSQFDL